eukprot:TRINITY_DN25043_c0_g4_i1.p1 TRINITY_DN25043_c0_g4~~TRINITY_DN25043_c0_g4_i1.p1  ORF type:complete len:797 (+),score=165.42 TRINITY_DN25043_c0_g4_i1:38-2392(+)
MAAVVLPPQCPNFRLGGATGSCASAFLEPCARAARYSLEHHLHDQASFFADRMLAASPADDAALELLADALLRSNEAARVRWILQAKGHLSNRLQYLLAVACLKLERYEEAEAALFNGDRALVAAAASGQSEAFNKVAEGAPGLFILGQAAEGQKKRRQALECYAKCLELSPFMWSAYERLSWLSLSAPKSPSCSAKDFAGTVFEASRFVKDTVLFPSGKGPLISEEGTSMPSSTLLKTATSAATAATQKMSENPGEGNRREETAAPTTPIGRKRRRSTTLPDPAFTAVGRKGAYWGDVTPPNTSPAPLRVPLSDRAPVTPVPAQASAASAQVDANAANAAAPVTPAATMARTPVSGIWSRLSPRRLLSSPFSSPFCSQGGGQPSQPSVGAEETRSFSSSSRTLDRAKAGILSTTKDVPLASLLQTLGEALHATHRFSCKEAIAALQSLPPCEQTSALVQDLAARCHFELADYAEAAKIYKKCCNQHTFDRHLGLEYYSTALWHLQESLELGDLSRRVLEWDRQIPQVWCAVGNCFSMQKEHEQAIRCFKRAVQLHPNFAYAQTLIGHEFVAIEKYDKAIQMYENALAIDCRHYNAWWGLGSVYQRQELFQKAKYHFQKAVEINGQNSVLKTSLGMACEALGDLEGALSIYSETASSKEDGALASFQKGCILTSLGRHKEALEALNWAKGLAPREPCVHFHLGKAAVGMGDSKGAFLHFTTAMDLCGGKDSKDHQLIAFAQEEILKVSAAMEQKASEASNPNHSATRPCEFEVSRPSTRRRRSV